jgi:hypothetical protein
MHFKSKANIILSIRICTLPGEDSMWKCSQYPNCYYAPNRQKLRNYLSYLVIDKYILTYNELDHSMPPCLPACVRVSTNFKYYCHRGAGKKIG